MARRSEEREGKRPCGREGESRRRRGAAEGGRRAEREGAKEARDEFFSFISFFFFFFFFQRVRNQYPFGTKTQITCGESRAARKREREAKKRKRRRTREREREKRGSRGLKGAREERERAPSRRSGSLYFDSSKQSRAAPGFIFFLLSFSLPLSSALLAAPPLGTGARSSSCSQRT